jgi:hypothetical protein
MYPTGLYVRNNCYYLTYIYKNRVYTAPHIKPPDIADHKLSLQEPVIDSLPYSQLLVIAGLGSGRLLAVIIYR